MKLRMQYAKPWLFRQEAEVDNEYVWRSSSKYMPHQNKRERDRRVKQMNKSANATFIYKG
jgi:hypothetical protein